MERMREFELGSHPESFQIEKTGSRIFANLPDQEAIGVIDYKTGAVTKWKIPRHSNTHGLGRFLTCCFSSSQHGVCTA
jgi:hypothetical protein